MNVTNYRLVSLIVVALTVHQDLAKAADFVPTEKHRLVDQNEEETEVLVSVGPYLKANAVFDSGTGYIAQLGYSEKLSPLLEVQALAGGFGMTKSTEVLDEKVRFKEVGGRFSALGRLSPMEGSFNFGSSFDLDVIESRATNGKKGDLFSFDIGQRTVRGGLSLSLGNKWIVADQVSLGFDWIGVSKPIFAIVKKYDNSGSDTLVSKDQRNYLQSTAERGQHAYQLRLFTLSIGIKI